MDDNEYNTVLARGMSEKERAHVIADLVFLAGEVIEPSYTVCMFYLRHLCYAYDSLPQGRSKDVPGLHGLFGYAQLPGKVLHDTDALMLESEYRLPGGFGEGKTAGGSAGRKTSTNNGKS